ncbi:DnaJ domain-containing protein [Desulfosoma caldarium]|uniref:Curved DNA-binding protein n=1 Tax=Desulfosoma caldarium TaxID=610254 RepID=A0A3N1UV03_9BACT|nr:DnaJ domain-containing protein [Desulfosoma caldarium]ROQ93259.1 curved DNA-binding protein [Desulfosoma caldarium]
MTSNLNDYYAILGVSPKASPEEIKRAFRKLALETHPDRNPGDRQAEERFKKINEAYGVLSDPQKRAEYDRYRVMSHRPGTVHGPAGGFGYSQEEIFRDFFTSRQAQEIFAEMRREFERMGFRFDDSFLNNIFFGGRTFVFRATMWGGPEGVRVYRSAGRYGTESPSKGHGDFSKPSSKSSLVLPVLKMGASLLYQAGKNMGKRLVRKALEWVGLGDQGHGIGADGAGGADVVYRLTIDLEEAMHGTVLEVALPHLGNKRVAVRIPPGVSSGTRLRLKSLGKTIQHHGLPVQGDTYIELRVEGM